MYFGYKKHIQLSIFKIEDFSEIKVTRLYMGYGKEEQQMSSTLEFLEANAT